MENTSEIIQLFDVISFIASLSSIILAILAIVLSIVFYKWSDKSVKEINKVSSDIDNNTKKIENLFDKLYSDTFSLMKSNVEVLQKRAYQSELISGDSGLSKIEQVEEVIHSIIQKTKQELKKDIIKFIQQSRIECKESEVLAAIENLQTRKVIIIEGEIVKLGINPSEDSGEEGKE